MSNAYGSNLLSTASAGFYITNMHNPISTASVSGMTIQLVSTSSSSYVIAQKLSGISMSVTTAATVDSITYAFSNPTTVEVYSSTNDYFLLTITPGVYISSG